MVIDLGGGTFDVTIMEFDQGVFEVKATGGDTQLDGTTMTQHLFDFLAQRFWHETGVDICRDLMAAARLRAAAEMAKIALSSAVTTCISLPFLADVAGQPRHFQYDLTRAELEQLVRPIIERRCRGPVEQTLHDASCGPRDIDRLVLVGGPMHMPVVRAFFEALLERQAEMGVDPMECVASGAAMQA
jgi:molecular chaperone DnaK